MKKKMFGTDGVRGHANIFPMTPENVVLLGMAAATVIRQKIPAGKRLCVLGRDPRLSSDFLASAFSAGCASCGVSVYDLGVVPTPSVSYLTHRADALFGAMISASHNPFCDNGIKIFSHEGIKIPDEWELEIEECMEKKNIIPAPDREIGRIQKHEEMITLYEEMLFSQISKTSHLKDLKAVIDCANGATYRIAEIIFPRIFRETVFINDTPDGLNINRDCGSTSMNSLASQVTSCSADLGMAFDGDGDRVLFCRSDGIIADGDFILGICARHMKRAGTLRNNTLVATIMSNLGMIRALEQDSITVKTVGVGDKYVYEEMLASDALVGGEQSGHIIFRESMQTGDGLLTAIKVLNVIEETGHGLDRLCSFMKKYPQELRNLRIRDKAEYRDNEELKEKIGLLSSNLSGDSRLVVRPSGTEPLLRIMAEAEDKNLLENILNKAEEIIREHIQVED